MFQLKLLAIRKSEKHNLYVFEKDQQFFSVLRQILEKLGFERRTYAGYARPTDEEYGEPIMTKEDKIKDYIDIHSTLENEKFFVEIFYGKNKIFLTIHTTTDRQEEISKIINPFIKD